MGEFIREHTSLLTKLVEFIAAITGLLCYSKYKNTPVKYFIWFLVYVLILEVIGGYTVYVQQFEFLEKYKEALRGTWFEKNHWLYNLFWNVGSGVFFVFYFREIIVTKIFKRILRYVGVLFLICAIGVFLYDLKAFFLNFSSIANILSSVVIILSIALYFIEMLQSDKVMVFYKSVNFYIASSMLIWCLMLTPITFYNIYYSQADWNFVFLKRNLYLFANYFMYLTFSFALLWCKPQND